jgi:hypothetical protein
MAYPKHIWRKGEIINAEPLNNMENGIANEEIRAIGAEEILDNKIEANKASSTDAIDTESIRATAAEDELSQRLNITNASIEELKNYVDTKTASTYKASGSVYFAELPELSSTLVGNVYNIKDSFTTTEDFYEGAGETYPAGTNVSIIQVEETTYIPDEVESSENPHDLGLYEYDSQTDTYILTEDTSPVSGKTYYSKYIETSLYYDVMAAAIDTSEFVKYTDIATNSRLGICKPDGNSIVMNDRGTFYYNIRNPRDATSKVSNLSLAVHHAELARYGFNIGDWFDATNYRYFIAGFNPFRGDSSSASDPASSICLSVDHIALVFSVGQLKWHDSGTSVMNVGYAGSDYQNFLETTVMDNVKEDMISIFGGETGLEYLRDITKYFRRNDDEPSLSRDRHKYISALTERQVYGSTIYSKDQLQTGEAYNQLEIFQKYLPVMSLEGGFWLRDIASSASACCVDDTGMPSTDSFRNQRNGAAMILFR